MHIPSDMTADQSSPTCVVQFDLLAVTYPIGAQDLSLRQELEGSIVRRCPSSGRHLQDRFEFCDKNIWTQHLHSSTGDEEPLVNAAINGSRRQVLVAGDGSELSLVSAVGRLLDLDVVTESQLAGKSKSRSNTKLTG